ncbi:hypothetical protein EGW08_019728 [Elysia chlorotica]|uniref:2-phosphoxylose phosphatase 1 n=1 Tax=Elysia chlorotica TaxID=188477 RepID=A0A433STF0_ELYCH|nr:hypothetical protein EGW08_019728 [Elysia chlorotica]
MNIQFMKTSVLALATGVGAYLYHARHSQGRRLRALHVDDIQTLETEYCPPKQNLGRAKVPEVPCREIKEGPLVLQLMQVQVLFRHGARTPMHTTPKISEADYGEDFLLRGHQASMFPYVRLTHEGELLTKWSHIETSLWKQPLRGGSVTGQLTAYGKEQMYNLGLRLRDDYMTRLDIATYNPDEVRIMSSNIRRTVESAQSVLAGLYGKEQLIDYAQCCGPVQIWTPDPCFNIMVPNTDTCAVLRKNNHHAMIHPDFLPGFKEKRLEVEEHIMKRRDSQLEAITEVQTRLDMMVQFYETEGVRTRRRAMNKHGQHYLHDPYMQPLFEERGRAIQKMDRFWVNVLNREPALKKIITRGDMRALVYLRDLEVEQFEGTLNSGYRIHLYFDKNPFFHDTYLCKEVFTSENPLAPPSRQSPIHWRSHKVRKLVQEALFQDEEEPDVTQKPVCEGPPKCPVKCKPKVEEPPVDAFEPEVFGEESFFNWFENPTDSNSDTVGEGIIGDVWKNPISVMENNPKFRDPWDNDFHFVYSKDDVTSRMTHGWWFPPELHKFRAQIEADASTILQYSMTGRNEEARRIITRLSAGPLLTEVIDTARKFTCGEKCHRLCFYSTHDSSLMALMAALGIWRNKWPPFGSDLRFELYRDVDSCNYYVRILYNDKEERIRDQTESFMHWNDFCCALKKYTIRREEMERICRSNILEKISEEVLKHSKGEVETSEIKTISDTPCGM